MLLSGEASQISIYLLFTIKRNKMNIYLSIYYLYIYLSFYLFIYLSIYVSVYLSTMHILRSKINNSRGFIEVSTWQRIERGKVSMQPVTSKYTQTVQWQ